MTTQPSIKRALLSVSDKNGLVDFANQLAAYGIQLIATGGTAALLEEANIKVTKISDYTNFPEILNGRVKTLHPKIYGGLLARGSQDDEILKNLQIEKIDLVIVNLYPFQKTIEKNNCSLEEAIEQIDIGGPTMVRAAAKNFNYVTIVVDPHDYSLILSQIQQQGFINLTTREHLAAKAFSHTAEYDSVIASYLQKSFKASSTLFPKELTLSFRKIDDLRYGENPHQIAALYQPSFPFPRNTTKLLQGKTLSFNNIVDSETAIKCVQSLDQTGNHPGCVIVKHATPCGAAKADSLIEAYKLAYQTDSTSAFGGIIAFNQPVNGDIAAYILQQQFIEVLIAPGFSEEALALCTKKPNLRVLTFSLNAKLPLEWSLHQVSNGLLIQNSDDRLVTQRDLTVVTKIQPNPKQIEDLLFAWNISKFVKSNAIVFARKQATLGIGSGQTSRVFSVEIGILKAKQAHLSLEQAVMASDAFLPFPDSVEIAAQAGINAIIQTGGSKRDHEVIAAANQANIAMIFTGVRHFRH